MKNGIFSQKKHLNWCSFALAASFCSLCMPWFSFNPQVTGYQWGISQGFPAVIAGLTALLLCIKLTPGPAVRGIITALLAFMPVWYVIRFFTWHYMTITGEISLIRSLEAARPGFYVSLGLSFVPLVVFWVCIKKEA